MRKVVFVVATVLCSALNAAPKTEANLDAGVILKGYDAVSYFEGPKPVMGKKELSVTTDGVTYLFSTEANKKKFEADAKRYLPAYGGWCATAVAGGYKFDIDPENYKITNGRLFLFYKGWRGDAKKDWLKDEPNQIQKADANWPTVRVMEK